MQRHGNVHYKNQNKFCARQNTIIQSELGTLEWWISGLMLNPLFLLIWRLNI